MRERERDREGELLKERRIVASFFPTRRWTRYLSCLESELYFFILLLPYLAWKLQDPNSFSFYCVAFFFSYFREFLCCFSKTGSGAVLYRYTKKRKVSHVTREKLGCCKSK